MKSNLFLFTILRFAEEAGQIAMSHIHKSSPTLKRDSSVVTLADKKISRLAKNYFKKFLQTPGHVLLDEEDENKEKLLDNTALARAKYIWAVDPIDGTRIYANAMPAFGISVGLLKDLKPWLGVVYFPFLNELFYCDGKDSYFVKNAFQKNSKKTRIKPIDQTINSHSIFFLTDSFFKFFEWKSNDCHVIIPACAVVDLCWPTIGRGCGTLLRSYLWDFAGSWPIVLSAGLNLRSVSSGKVLTHVDEAFFSKTENPWRIKDHYIVSSEKNFPILQAKLKTLP